MLIIREMQMKTTMRYHLTLVRMAIIKKSTNISSLPLLFSTELCESLCVFQMVENT